MTQQFNSYNENNPKIVLVGPTNVGKSALFNRLTKTRAAIVCDRPGVTVDRHELSVEDTPAGPVTIVDTGGVGPTALSHELGKEIERAAALAVSNAALILFVVDGTREIGFEEFEIATWLRKQKNIDNKTIWVLVNKSDSKKHDDSSYYSLGFEKVLSLSAEHNIGLQEIWQEISDYLSTNPSAPKPVLEKKSEEDTMRILVLGRPNVGKSTLLNSLLGEDRHVVSQMAGTTRDPIQSDYHYKNFHFQLVDTAGLRQPGRLERDVEWVAREKLKDQARAADVAIVVLDASAGISDLDASIIGMAIDFGLSVVLAYNKWDLMKGDDFEDLMSKLDRSSDMKLDFVKWCPHVKLSALTGKGIGELLKQVQAVIEARKIRVQTSKLNILFERKFRLHHHPLASGNKVARFYYLSQVSSRPPEFVLFANIGGKEVHFSFRRFVVNSLRDEFGFKGTPIRLHFKTARGEGQRSPKR